MCADITKCVNKRCASRTMCYRYTAKSGKFQSQGDFKPSPDALRCVSFWDNATLGRKREKKV